MRIHKDAGSVTTEPLPGLTDAPPAVGDGRSPDADAFTAVAPPSSGSRAAPVSPLDALTLPALRSLASPVRVGLTLSTEFFALDEANYFAHLDLVAAAWSPTSAADYEFELLERADEAIEVLRCETAASDVRIAAAHYLLFTAMFIKVGNDGVRDGTLTLEQLRSRLAFADISDLGPGRARRAEIVAREQFALACLQLVASVDTRELVNGFLATTRARVELERDFLVSEATYGELLDSIGHDSIFNLVSMLAGVRPAAFDATREAELQTRISTVLMFGRADSSSSRTSRAPWAREVSMVLIGDALMRYAIDAATDRYPLALMIAAVGPAQSMYRQALESAGPTWPFRSIVEARLLAAATVRERLFGADVSLSELRGLFADRPATGLGSCASCHRER